MGGGQLLRHTADKAGLDLKTRGGCRRRWAHGSSQAAARRHHSRLGVGDEIRQGRATGAAQAGGRIWIRRRRGSGSQRRHWGELVVIVAAVVVGGEGGPRRSQRRLRGAHSNVGGEASRGRPRRRRDRTRVVAREARSRRLLAPILLQEPPSRRTPELSAAGRRSAGARCGRRDSRRPRRRGRALEARSHGARRNFLGAARGRGEGSGSDDGGCRGGRGEEIGAAPPARSPDAVAGAPSQELRPKLTRYLESGVPKEKAKYKIIFVHGFDSCRYDVIQVSPELAQELGVYLLSFDRPGYGESDPDPAPSEKSIALDIEELADNLQLGPKFHLIGFSMGGEIMWSCLKYIPHRLSGVAVLGPVGNYWWSGLPSNLSWDAWYQQLPRDQWAVWVSHHLPWLTYWWNTQKLFPASSVIAYNPALLSEEDAKLMEKFGMRTYMPMIRQQGEYYCLHRDMMVGFGKWGWSPLDLKDPFAGGEGKVHLWHGAEDRIVPVSLSRYISERLPWVVYHELPKSGHLFPVAQEMANAVVKSLVLGEQ